MISIYRHLDLGWRENEWYHLVPFGDVHRNSPDHEAKRYEAFIKRCTARSDTLVVGMGEYEDLMSTSERAHWKQKDWHDGTEYWFEEKVKGLVVEHAELLSPLAATGRLLGLAEGHHYYKFQKDNMLLGKTSTEYLCSLLDVPYLGTQFLIYVGIPIRERRGRNLSLKIWGHHGKGGSGRDKGMGTLRNLIGYWDADCYLMGHNHCKAVDRITVGGYQQRPTLGPVTQILPWHHKIKVLARTGTFLKGYNESPYPSYQELNAYPPTDLGVVNIAMCWKREQRNGIETTRLDLHPSL